MPSEPEDAVQLLRSSALFGGLLDEDYELLRAGTRVRSFPSGSFLFYEHDEGGSAFLIIEGLVGIERTTETPRGDHETVQIAVRGAGEFIGELSLFDDTPRSADARAIEATTVLQLRGKHVLSCAQQSPELAFSLMRELAGKLREATDRRTVAKVANVRTRLVQVLEEEGRLHGVEEPAGTRIPLSSPTRKLTQSELGVRAGCDRAVVNRTLAELVQEGLVEKDRASILLRKLPRSQAVAGTLLRAARENPKGASGNRVVSESQLQNAPVVLALTAKQLEAEIRRLAEDGIVEQMGEWLEIRDEAGLSRRASSQS